MDNPRGLGIEHHTAAAAAVAAAAPQPAAWPAARRASRCCRCMLLCDYLIWTSGKAVHLIRRVRHFGRPEGSGSCFFYIL